MREGGIQTNLRPLLILTTRHMGKEGPGWLKFKNVVIREWSFGFGPSDVQLRKHLEQSDSPFPFTFSASKLYILSRCSLLLLLLLCLSLIIFDEYPFTL